MSTQRFDHLVEENETAERKTVPAVDECVISARLTFSDMPGQRKGVHLLESGENTIGRAAGNKVILDHPSISERHAIISVVDDCMFIKDCGSTNRTWLWDAARGTFQPRSLARLRDGDYLRLGTLEAQLALQSTAKEEQRAVEGEARLREGRERAAAEPEAVPHAP
ncbi:fha domain containing protein [Nannochloropsis gaditana]|uniref:Fha domain containing protein n=1 Tax=Nannochloropsis gaditana TaxID=72520 RepID=W7T4I5_9STRA|nr:fha domain containing protein [Nannochloropsis gaditana]